VVGTTRVKAARRPKRFIIMLRNPEIFQVEIGRVIRIAIIKVAI